MKKLVLFSGLPGVGKTTISRAFCQENNGQVIDIDDFKKTTVNPSLVKSEIDPPEIRWEYYEKALQHAHSLFLEGHQLVVMDEVFHLSSLRKRIEEFSLQRNIEVVWIEIKCPYSVVVDRLSRHERTGHLLSREEALLMYRMFNEIFEPFENKRGSRILVRNTGFVSMDQIVRFIQAKM